MFFTLLTKKHKFIIRVCFLHFICYLCIALLAKPTKNRG